MAWSDAARAASLEVRRRHAKQRAIGKKITPTTWFHGGPAMRGTKLLNTVGEHFGGRYSMGGNAYEGGGKLRKGASASNSAKEARAYGSTLYRVTLPKAAIAHRVQKSRLGWIHKEFKNFREVTAISPGVMRLPRAKGRASRGKY